MQNAKVRVKSTFCAFENDIFLCDWRTIFIKAYFAQGERIMRKQEQPAKLSNDEKIIDMYWERNPDAIYETDRKYGAML